MKVLIVGAGIGGLTLALELQRAGIDCQVVEASRDLAPIGAGINLLPHASRVLARLGLEPLLAGVAVQTRESAFFNRFGQHIYTEPAGRAAGYEHPQFSIHRGDLQEILLGAVHDRLGERAVSLGRRVLGVTEAPAGPIAHTVGVAGDVVDLKGDVVIGCDGVHSAIRRQLYPDEGEPRYSGVNMWRGVTWWRPVLSGATMVRAGWLAHGKMVIYPVRRELDDDGLQMTSWVAEVQTPQHADRSWDRTGRLADFIGHFEDWHFDWLDVPRMIRSTPSILQYPMVDQEPLQRWTFGHVTLLGDAAHPMVPRGSNGAAQAILDAQALAQALVREADPASALAAYEAERRPASNAVVLANRRTPPDAILREVWERTGDRPFTDIDDVISRAELAALTDRYKHVAGYGLEQLEVTD
ncbi:flavin-dependent oxidoreductase [Georgenia sp. SYP-B2076]|uniref:flavin-dependent oxidoreductase n=1 Tax=Georgenia sp. SYP-B2076 TaxID=2495881 RepID=UPI000F8E99BD|nr:flavin-dependent oxidoreductase [Georgenia sp. SYP-B2076]